MNSKEALEWAEDLTEEFLSLMDEQCIKTLAATVREQEGEIAEYKYLELLYHQKMRCECGDDEACAHVRRAEAAERELLYQTALAETATVEFGLANKENDELRANLLTQAHGWHDEMNENDRLRERLKAAEELIAVFTTLTCGGTAVADLIDALAEYEKGEV